MPPLFDWWGRDTHQGTPVVVKMDNPNWSISDADDDFVISSTRSGKKGARGKNAKQLTWVLLLKAHRAAGCLASLGSAVVGIASAVRRRLLSGRTDEADEIEEEEEEEDDHGRRGMVILSPPGDEAVPSRTTRSRRLYSFIKAFLFVSLAMLLFEIAAYINGSHSISPEIHRLVSSSFSVHGFFDWVYTTWMVIRVDYIAPPLQFLANVCVALFLIQSADRFILCLGCFWIRLKGIKPEPKHTINPVDKDLESGEKDYFPMVLVQIPMCNEKEVYHQSIAAACNLDWPKNDILIQVLDDSDDPITRCLIKEEVINWQRTGVRIVYRHRLNREGYKAGNLKSAMNCDYVKDYEFVTIFDADFQPSPDFLKRTVPHFKENDEIGLVQARWSFVNKDENLLTRLQNINLCFHFEVEQQVNGIFLNFFGFNGTAGVWRIKALVDAGGWMERTTVEDMDIAVRAHLKGWKFVYLNDVECQCELPESYEAYRKQQHRWHSGPMQLFRLCLPAIIRSRIGFWKKSNLIFLFFLLRKLVLPFYSFTLFCIILPITMFIPEAELPSWVICYIPAIMSFLNILPSPKSFPFIVPYLLFENTMSVTKFNAMISGLLQLGSAYEWVVTKKSGRSSEGDLHLLEHEKEADDNLQIHSESAPDLDALLKEKLEKESKKEEKKKKHNRIYRKELTLAFLLLTAAAQSLLSAQGIHFYFLLFQGISFLLVGLDLIGEQID